MTVGEKLGPVGLLPVLSPPEKLHAGGKMLYLRKRVVHEHSIYQRNRPNRLIYRYMCGNVWWPEPYIRLLLRTLQVTTHLIPFKDRHSADIVFYTSKGRHRKIGKTDGLLATTERTGSNSKESFLQNLYLSLGVLCTSVHIISRKQG